MDTHMRRTLAMLTISLFVQAVATLHLCKTCKHIQDPLDCRLFADCGNKLCGVDLYYNNGVYLYDFDCTPQHDCPDSGTILVGKRAASGQLVCRGCCEGHGCESSLCAAYATTLPPVTTPVPTTVDLRTTTPTITTTTTTTTTTPTTTLPTTTDFNMYSGYTSHITGITTIPSTLGGTCVDADQFICTKMDRYNFCTDTTSFAYAIAHEKCPRHCGFCTPEHVTTSTTTERQFTVTHALINTATTPAFMSASSGCVDTEDIDFSCSNWASLGFCSNQSSFFGHQVAITRCLKTCGFCTH